jgi:rhodanese-related sulfurtransferase
MIRGMFEIARSASARLAGLLLLALTLVGCGASSPAPTNTPSAGLAALPREVSVAEANRLRQDGAMVLDVREPSEWASGHIGGATLVPLGELAGRTSELPRDRTIVVVCRSGNRSAQGRDILFDAGFPAVTSMAGGMTDWISAGLPVTTGS